jgi:hypothetical protein
VKLKNKSGELSGFGNLGLILLSAGFCRGNLSVVALAGAGMVVGQVRGPAPTASMVLWAVMVIIKEISNR